jgi:hypothetical protein
MFEKKGAQRMRAKRDLPHIRFEIPRVGNIWFQSLVQQ